MQDSGSVGYPPFNQPLSAGSRSASGVVCGACCVFFVEAPETNLNVVRSIRLRILSPFDRRIFSNWAGPMNTEVVDVADILLGRTRRHLFARGVAEFLDFLVLVLPLAVFVPTDPEKLTFALLGLMLLYFTATESVFGFTLGKLACGLRVIGADGRSPTGFRSFVRNLLRPFEAFGLLGIILVICTKRGQRLGDLAAETFVVRPNELEELSSLQRTLTEAGSSGSQQIVSLSPEALELARRGIASSTRPSQTCLLVAECSDAPRTLTIQYDLLELDDTMQQWTADGITISVPKNITERYGPLTVEVADGKLVVAPVAA